MILWPKFWTVIDYAFIMEGGNSSVTRSNKRPRSELEGDNLPYNNGDKSLEPQDEGMCSSGVHFTSSNARPNSD